MPILTTEVNIPCPLIRLSPAERTAPLIALTLETVISSGDTSGIENSGLVTIFADTFFSYITPLVIKIYLLKDKIFYCNILYYSGRKLMEMLNYYSQLKLYFFYLFLSLLFLIIINQFF